MSVQGYGYGAVAGLELAGGYFASQNIKETAEINRDISNMNAEFAELDAYDAHVQGFTRQAQYQSVIDQTIGEQQAFMTAQGIDVNYGSAASVQNESRFFGQLNLMQIQRQAQEQTLGYQRQARDYRVGGSLQYSGDIARAGQAQFAGFASAAKSGLTGYERSL